MTTATGTASSFWSGWIHSEGQQEQSIKIKPIYIDINDNNLTDGVIFSQIVYWHTPDKEGKSRLRVFRNGHLWLAKSYDDWWKECRIPERTARASLTRIEKRGLIERHVWQFNGVPTVHVRIITDAFELAVKKVDPSLIRQDQPNGSGKTGQMVSAKSDTSFKTENTTETTKESPQPPTEPVVETPEPAESKAAQERGGEGGEKSVKDKRKASKPRKLTDEHYATRQKLFEIVCIGSFGKPYQKINGSKGLAVKIAQKIHLQRPDITPELLEGGYRYFAKKYPDLIKDPDSRVRDIEKILHYVGLAEEDSAAHPKLSPPDPNCEDCKGAGYWIDKITDQYNHKKVTCGCRVPEGSTNG